MIELSDADILARLTNSEDSTVERKTANDYRDCLKTAVAFSNSLPVDDPGIIFVGVGDDGTPQDRLNPDSLQKDVSKELAKIYPPIMPQMKVMRKDGKEFLAVIVRGSGNRPHFAGPSYRRDGSQTVVASEQQFEELVAQRVSKGRKLLEWQGKPVTVDRLNTENLRMAGRVSSSETYTVQSCNEFWVTLLKGGTPYSFPLRRVELSFDDDKNCLKLEIYPL